MNSLLSNLYLLAFAIGKTLGMTGLGFAILGVYAAEMLVKLNRVPALTQGEKVVSDEHSSSKISYTLNAGSQIQHAVRRRNAMPLLDWAARGIGKSFKDANTSASIERPHGSRVA